MSDELLCPFSKPIIGQWCDCPHAILSERCSGKMVCGKSDEMLAQCRDLVAELKQASRFVLGLSTDEDEELTHAQLMKIRCGGLLGMQAVIDPQRERPELPELIERVKHVYGGLAGFPYSDIVPSIQQFSHRQKKSSRPEPYIR